MKCFVAKILVALILPYSSLAQLQYPKTKKTDTVDEYHGTKVSDPYRWLEDDNSEETKAWVIAQNKTTHQYLASIPYRDQVKKRLEELVDWQRRLGLPGFR